MTTEPEEKEVVTGDSEGDAGGLPNYVPTGGDRRIQVVYRDWVHSKYRSHLSGDIADDQEWNTRWENLVVVTTRWYDAPIGRVGRRFVHALAAELTGVRKRRWNAERFIVFQAETLQSARQVIKYYEIWRQIDQRLDAWEAGEHEMLAEDTARTYM